MPIEVIDKGQNNRLNLSPWFENNSRLKITFTGNNAIISIPRAPKSCSVASIRIGNDCEVEIGGECHLSSLFVFAHNNSRVKIGPKTSFTNAPRFMLHEPSSISLGEDCMIAGDVLFTTSDMHTIYDVSSKQRTNWAKDITIGDHIWVGLQSCILKGAKIGNNSIIGLRSVVTDEISANSLAVGNPAKVIRTGVNWDRQLWAK